MNRGGQIARKEFPHATASLRATASVGKFLTALTPGHVVLQAGGNEGGYSNPIHHKL